MRPDIAPTQHIVDYVASMFTAAKDIRYAETKAGVTRPGIAPQQQIVDYFASMFPAAGTSGRRRQRLAKQGQSLRLRSILWIMLQVYLQLLGHQVGGGKGWRHKVRHCACAANCGLYCTNVPAAKDIR